VNKKTAGSCSGATIRRSAGGMQYDARCARGGATTAKRAEKAAYGIAISAPKTCWTMRHGAASKSRRGKKVWATVSRKRALYQHMAARWKDIDLR